MCFLDSWSIEIACSIWSELDRGVGDQHFVSTLSLAITFSWEVFNMACNTPCCFIYPWLLPRMLSWQHFGVLETQFVHQFCSGEDAALFGGSLLCVPGSLLHKQGTVYRTFLIPRHLFYSFFSILSSLARGCGWIFE